MIVAAICHCSVILPSLVSFDMRFIQVFAVTLGFLSVCVHARAEVIRFDDLNCSIKLSSEWKCSYDLGSREEFSKQMFLKGRRGRETAMVLVGSEGVGPGNVVDHDEVYVGLIDAMLARFHARQTIRSGTLNLDGVDGAYRIVTTQSDAGQAGYAGAWYGEKNGYLYSLTIVETEATASASRMIQACESIWADFRLIDSTRIGFSGNELRAERWTGLGLLSVDLRSIGWVEVEQEPSDYLRSWNFGNIASLEAGAIPLGAVDLNEDAILDALFTFLKVNRQLSIRSDPKETQLGGMPAKFIQVEVKDSRMPLVQYLKYTQHDGYLVYSWLVCAADEVSHRYPELVSQSDHAIQYSGTHTAVDAFAIAPVLANFYNELGLAVSRRSSPSFAYPLIAQAYTCAPDNPVFLSNVLDIALLVQQEASAKKLVEDCDPELLLDPNVLARLALIESRTGRRVQAMELFQQAIDLGLREVEYIQVFLDMLSEEGRDDDALAVLRQLRATGQDRNFMLIEVGFYIRKEAFDQAARVLSELEELYYRDANSVLFWAEVFLSTEQYEPCVAMCEEYLLTDRNSGVMVSLARALIEKKEIRAAKKWIEHAIEISPTDQSLKTYHDYISAMLGRQGNVVLDFEIQPVPVSEELNAPISHPRTEDEIAAGAHFDLYSKAIQFSDEGIYKTTFRYKLTVHDKAGLREWNEISIPFEPLYEKLFVNDLRVYDSAGELIFEGSGDLDSLYVVEDTSSGILTNAKVLRIPLIGLEVGASAELMVSSESASTSDQLPFKEHFFAARVPVRVSTLSIDSPDGSLAMQAFNLGDQSTTFREGEWRMEYPAEFRDETHLPNYSDYAAFVATGPHGKRWEDIGNQYWKDVCVLFVPKDWTLEVAKSIRAEFPHDKKAQMASAMAYVQDRLRYQGVLFGVRYRIPNEAGDILRNGYGDCKDHSLLLVQLLQALDVECSPFLLNTNDVYAEAITTADQFNHMLVYATTDGVDYFLDATKKSQDPLQPDLGLAGSYGLIVKEGTSAIIQIPSIVELLDIRINRQHVLADDGQSISVRETAEFSRAAADQYRDVIYHVSRRDIDKWLEQILSYRNVDVDLQESNMSDLFEFSSGMEVDLHYNVYDYNAAVEQGISHSLGWERMYLNFKGDSSRKLPFRIEAPIRMTTTSSFRASNGASLGKYELKDSAETKWCRWVFSVDNLDDAVEVTASIDLHPGIYSASEYSAFRQTIGQFIAHLESPIRVIEEPTKVLN